MGSRFMATVLVSLLAAAAAGCGSAGNSTTSAAGSSTTSAAREPTTAPPLPRREFVAQASRFCAQSLRRGEEHALRVFHHKSQLYIEHGNLDEFVGVLRRQEMAIVLAPSLRHRLEKVKRLGIPERDAAQVEKILGVTGKAAHEAELNPAGFLEAGAPMKPARRLAAAYGIEACAILFRDDGLYDRGSANPGARLTPRSSK